jgi:hypothetical protein
MTPIELASEFAKLGYYVFPLIKSIKGPHVKPFGWARNTVHDPTKADILIPATNDLTEIETWPLRVKRGYKSTIAGFGITGFGCVILDLDVKGGKNGIAEFAEMIKDYGIPKTPMMTISKSGGLHLFYAKPAKYAEDYVKTLSGVKIEGKDFPGVDLRGDGGFVVGPQMLVDDIRMVESGYYGMSGLTHIQDLPALPERVVAGWIKRTGESSDLDNMIGLYADDTDFKSLIRRGIIPDFIPKGARNESFFIFIGVLKSKGTPIEVTRKMCHELATKVEDPDTLVGSVDIEAMLAKAYVFIPENPYDVAIDLINRGLFQVTGYKSELHYVIMEDNPYVASRGVHTETAMKTMLLRFQKPFQGPKGKVVQLNPMHHLVKVIGDENRVDLLGFKPNAGEVFSLHDEPGSKRFLNTYRPILIQCAPRDVDEDLWAEFELLVERLFGHRDSVEYQMGMDFISWLIQTPEIKPSISPFIMSVNRGVGKSLFFNVLISIMGTAKNGERQAKLVKLDEITGRFFDPSGCIINLIDEVQFPVHRDTRRESTTFWRHLKNLITAETVSVEIKGGATYQCPNSAAVALAGNFGSYFPIEEFDRRLWIVDAGPVALELGTVDRLFDLVRRSALDPDDRNRYVATLRYKLKNWKIKNDLSTIRAPMTAVKQEMYENSLTDLEEWFVTHFRDPGNLFAFTPIISQSAMYYVYEQSGRLISDNQTFFRDLKRKGYLRPIKLKSNTSLSRQFSVNTINLDGSIMRSDKREILYTSRDHGSYDTYESEKIIDMFNQNCASIIRFKQQQINRVTRISEEQLLGRK